MTSGAVIVVWNGAEHLTACLESVLDQTAPPRHVVVIDNGSTDGSLDIAETLGRRAQANGASWTFVREDDNTGFVAGANRGLRHLLAVAPGVGFALLLNQDAALESNWCQAVATRLSADDRVGAVGSRILMPDRLTLQHAGGYLERPRLMGRHFGHHQPNDGSGFVSTRDVEFVTGAAMALRLAALRQVGMFDEIFSPGYYEDVEWCARARAAGWTTVYEPTALAIHVESSSFSQRPDRLTVLHRNRLLFALPMLADRTCREDFCRAERDYVSGAATVDERRAVGSACLAVLLMMPDVVDARLPRAMRASEGIDELAEDLGQLRRDVLAVGRSDDA